MNIIKYGYNANNHKNYNSPFSFLTSTRLRTNARTFSTAAASASDGSVPAYRARSTIDAYEATKTRNGSGLRDDEVEAERVSAAATNGAVDSGGALSLGRRMSSAVSGELSRRLGLEGLLQSVAVWTMQQAKYNPLEALLTHFRNSSQDEAPKVYSLPSRTG